MEGGFPPIDLRAKLRQSVVSLRGLLDNPEVLRQVVRGFRRLFGLSSAFRAPGTLKHPRIKMVGNQFDDSKSFQIFTLNSWVENTMSIH